MATFAPQLFLKNVRAGFDFYKKAFGAVEISTLPNADGSLHVAELSIDGAMFHLHQEVKSAGQLSPAALRGTPVLIGLFVSDPDKVMASVVSAGGQIISPMQDYEYGYRQGSVADPFGHQWMIQKKI